MTETTPSDFEVFALRVELDVLARLIMRHVSVTNQLLKDLTLLFEDATLPTDTLDQRIAKYSEHQSRIEAAILADTGVSPPDCDAGGQAFADYRRVYNEWITDKNILKRLFQYTSEINGTGPH